MKRFRNMIRPFHVFAVFGISALIAALFFLLGNALSYFVYFPEFVQMTSWDYHEYTMAYSFVFGGSAPFFAITEEGFHEGSENLIHPSFLALPAWITMVASLCASVVGLLLLKSAGLAP